MLASSSTRTVNSEGKLDANELLKLCKKTAQTSNYDDILQACRAINTSDGATVDDFIKV